MERQRPTNDAGWQQMWDLFHGALEQPVETRKEWLESACADDADLLARVQRLLVAHGRSSGVLDKAAAGTATEVVEVRDPLIGERIGHYRLLEQIGEGGMGIVYLAEQEQPVRRRVALKLIRLGMDSKEVLARFESERQALAIMDHPRIAKVFDAGVTESGRSYFAMEYVPGIPITEYCDLRNLNLRERLALFSQACEAIDHAHRKGIIHRDIKPSNLLVAAIDGKPSLKVIDFGVAKATNQRLTERTLFTQQGMFVGTPGYMSPEQAGTTPLEVGTRTDVYSLGVLLYELLVGALPFDPNTLRDVALVEMQRIIREEDPPTPSARVAHLGKTAEQIARQRHLDPRSLAREVRGELEWITMRALEKDPSRRYPTAAELGADVGRYLTCEPVQAGPPSVTYRLGKFVRRRRAGLAAAAAVLLMAAALVAAALRPTPETVFAEHPPAPLRRLVVDKAGNFNFTIPTADGRRLLRYDLDHRGYETVDIDSRERTLLTHDGPDPERTIFASHDLSPDETSIAGVVWLPEDPSRIPGFQNDGGLELRIFAVGGAGPGRTLYAFPPGSHVEVFAWSPDATRVWVWIIHPDHAGEIASIGVESGSIESLVTIENRSHTQGPSLSPDGRFVAYHERVEDGPREVVIRATDGSGEHRLGQAGDSRPLFLPDGSGIVFKSKRRTGSSDIWFQPLTDGRPDGEARIVFEDPGFYGVSLRFGRNGSLFYYFATNGWESYTLDIDLDSGTLGVPVRLDPQGDEMNTSPAYSPDGRYLAYARGSRRMAVRDLATGREREFPVPRLSGFHTSWCRDGASLIVSSARSGGDSALLVDLERGGAEPLEAPWGAACVGNAEAIVYGLDTAPADSNREESELVLRSLSSGTERVLYASDADVNSLRVSPDDRRIAFVEIGEEQARLLVVRVDGGEAKTVMTVPVKHEALRRLSEFKGVMWLPDGNGLLVVRHPLDQQMREVDQVVSLWRVPLDGAAPVELSILDLPDGGFFGAFNYTLHPAGSRLAFQLHAGFLAQTWAIDNLMAFIRSGRELALVGDPSQR